MRKHFIDNLRWLCVLALFPYHTFMVYNNFGESFYVKGADIHAGSQAIRAVSPWLMPLMFAIAGVSSAYALQKRSIKEYTQERVSKLLIPLLFGILLLVPIQTFFAERFHNGYTGSFFAQYILFFTKPTDLSGYQGGFTPAHLWFILYLFVISLLCLPLMAHHQKARKKLPVQKLPLFALLLFFIIPIVSQMVLDIGGKSVGEYMTYFLFGYYMLSNDSIQQKLQKHRFLLLGLALPCLLVFTLAGISIENYNSIAYECLYSFYAWASVLAIFGFGKQHLNFTNHAFSYLSSASFSIYIFHQQWIVIAAYFALMWIQSIPLQMILIAGASAVFAFLNYELFRRISVTRWMFGIKNKADRQAP